MNSRLLKILACPKCRGPLISEGQTRLSCSKCCRDYPIIKGIPRFVERENYASSFGYQWNRFKYEQLDSINGRKISKDRFFKETGWQESWLKNKSIIEVGCGAGRFLDVVSSYPCQVVGIDISDAVDAAAATMSGRSNVHLVQASVYELPFRDGAFDACYSIGVIQHTPKPLQAIESLPRVLKPGGRVAVTIYERKRWTLLNAKYLVRPLTKRLNKSVLLALIRLSAPILFPLTDVLFRLPQLGRLFSFAIPVADLTRQIDLSFRQRYHWFVLDTFDMLSPEFDEPQTRQDVEKALIRSGISKIQRLKVSGLNLVGEKV